MIKTKQSLVQFSTKTIDEAPEYYSYALPVQKIKEYLKTKTGDDFQLYVDSDTSNEIWEVLEEDLDLHPENVTELASIFDCLEMGIISSNHTDKEMELILKPSLYNHLYYYEKHNVALVRMPSFQKNELTQYDYILASSEESLSSFLDYVLKRKRDYIKDYVTIFIDTEDGVENRKEKITTLVKRDDVFLEDKLKNQIYRSIDEFFTNGGEFFHTYQIPYKRGILLYGKPGNGKTTLVKSIATSIEAPVAYWQITEYTSSYSIQEVFSSVAKMSPMVLVIEDIDSMPQGIRSVFLNTLDGATSKEGIYLIGTTNYPERIDPALINRSGRFDRAYEIKLPTSKLREQYLMKKNSRNLLKVEEISELVSVTNEFSYAQLNELYNSIALQKHYEDNVNIIDICNELKADNKKGKRNAWSNNDEANIGF